VNYSSLISYAINITPTLLILLFTNLLLQLYYTNNSLIHASLEYIVVNSNSRSIISHPLRLLLLLYISYFLYSFILFYFNYFILKYLQIGLLVLCSFILLYFYFICMHMHKYFYLLYYILYSFIYVLL